MTAIQQNYGHFAQLSPWNANHAFVSFAQKPAKTAVHKKEEKRIPCDIRAEGISISPDGGLIAIGNVGAHTVSIIDTKKQEIVHTLKETRGPIRTVFSADGRKIFVSCAESGEIAVFDAKTYAELKRINLAESKKFTLKGGAHPMPMNYERHPDGNHLFVVVLNADAVAILDTDRLEVVSTLETGSLPDGIGFSSYPVVR